MEELFLPLYSRQGGIHVPERSGLNQWNADGRLRDSLEVYIPVFREIHHMFPNFFPHRNIIFNLILPNGQNLQAKICQAGNKALMSNPNSDLGYWLLREVLNIEPHILVTYQMLVERQIDCVVIRKENNQRFFIDVAPFRSYERQFNR